MDDVLNARPFYLIVCSISVDLKTASKILKSKKALSLLQLLSDNKKHLNLDHQ